MDLAEARVGIASTSAQPAALPVRRNASYSFATDSADSGNVTAAAWGTGWDAAAEISTGTSMDSRRSHTSYSYIARIAPGYPRAPFISSTSRWWITLGQAGFTRRML